MGNKLPNQEGMGGKNFIPQYNDYNAQVIDRTENVKSIFDVMNDLGYDIYGFNSERMRPLTTSQDGIASSYRVKEFAHFGLGGEYNDQIGVALHTGSIRYIDFVYGKEEYFQGMKYDPITDGNRDEHGQRVAKDYGKALVKNRPKKYLEQVINSGMLFKTGPDYLAFYKALGLDFVAPSNPDNMTLDELEQFLIAISAFYEEKEDVEKVPVILLGTNEWSKIVKSENFQKAIWSNETNQALMRENQIGMIHNVVVGKYAQLGIPAGAYKDVRRIVLCPGTSQLQERIIRPVQYRPYSEALGMPGAETETLGNKVIDAEFFTGTYEQWVILVDNLKNDATGVAHFTERYMVCGSTLVQDHSKVLFGSVKGEVPTVKEATNRTMSSVIKAQYDSQLTGEQKPKTDDGDTHGTNAAEGVSAYKAFKLSESLTGVTAEQLKVVAKTLGLSQSATVSDIMATVHTIYDVESVEAAIIVAKGSA